MSIAVSAIVRSSRVLGTARLCLCALTIASGALLAITGHARAPYWIGAACALAGVGAIFPLKPRKTLRIDISGVGQIRLTVYQGMGLAHANPALEDSCEPVVVSLMAGSTLWPHLLLLRLRAQDGKVSVVPLLPDCAAPSTLRALAVACRAIAARSGNVV